MKDNNILPDKIKAAIKSGKLIPLEKYMERFTPEEKVWIEERARYLETAMAIRHLRHQLKLSQQELADKMNVKREVITRAKSGRHNVTLETLHRIAKATHHQVSISFK